MRLPAASEQFLPSSLARSGFSLLTAAPHAFFCCLLPVGGLERPPRFPWQRSGVAPDRRGSRKQKMQKANRDRHRSVPGLPSFLIVVFGPLLESLTLLHSSEST